MLKTLIAAAALTLAGAAGAAPLYYHFEWRGFNVDTDDGVTWRPDAAISGYFRGEDLDGDNVIRDSEISILNMNGDGNLLGCPATGEGDGLTNCSVYGFAFDQASRQLTFHAEAEWSFSGSIYARYYWDMPGDYTSFDTDYPYNSTYSYSATENTRFRVVSVVPEPSTWAMLAGGLLVAGGAARRRTRQRR